MTFWTDSTSLEPQRQYRWYINFNYTGNDRLSLFKFALKSCTKPSYKIDTTSHVLLNHTFNYPKNVVWSPISVSMVSARGKNKRSLAGDLNFILNYGGYKRPDVQSEQTGVFSKKIASFESISIYQVDVNGNIAEEWSLANSFINNVNFGSLTYEDEGFVEIKFDITYDYANFSIPDIPNEGYEGPLPAMDPAELSPFPQTQTPDTAPAQQTPDTAPAQQTPDTAPAQQTPDTAPAQQTPDTAPAQQTPDTAPAQQTPDTAPAQQTPIQRMQNTQGSVLTVVGSTNNSVTYRVSGNSANMGRATAGELGGSDARITRMTRNNDGTYNITTTMYSPSK